MTITIETINPRQHILTLSYADEGIHVTTTKKIIGTIAAVEAYVPIFDRDIRMNHPEYFPLPEPPEHEEEII